MQFDVYTNDSTNSTRASTIAYDLSDSDYEPDIMSHRRY